MNNIAIIAKHDVFSVAVGNYIRNQHTSGTCNVTDIDKAGCSAETFIFIPGIEYSRDCYDACLNEARSALDLLKKSAAKKVIILSSSEIFSPRYNHPGFVDESYYPIPNLSSLADFWIKLETLFRDSLSDDIPAIFLRLAPILDKQHPHYFNTLLQQRLVMTVPGRNPMLQFIGLNDGCKAIWTAVNSPVSGTFHIAANGSIPFFKLLSHNHILTVPFPACLQKSHCGLDRIQYPWTVSTRKAEQQLAFVADKSCNETVLEFAGFPDPAGLDKLPDYDDDGMDTTYIHFFSQTLFKFLHSYYWRIEVSGIHNIPPQGAAVLVGIHRGFMPFDGAMMVHLLSTSIRRYPRFLIDSALTKLPFLSDFMYRLGGVIATRDNADRMLQKQQLLGIYPEGIQGAFSYYKDAYKLKRFGYDEYVKTALRNSVPIIPFVTVGSAEIFPILAKIHWPAWIRFTGWPCLPITPTFPWLPIPLPSKWHTRILEPLHIEQQYPPTAADDPKIVNTISTQVKSLMLAELESMREQRKSIFFGCIFEHEPVDHTS